MTTTLDRACFDSLAREIRDLKAQRDALAAALTDIAAIERTQVNRDGDIGARAMSYSAALCDIASAARAALAKAVQP